MGKHLNELESPVATLEEVGRHHYEMSYQDGTAIEDLVRIAIDNAMAFYEVSGRRTTIEFERNGITVRVDQNSPYLVVIERFKFALLTSQSSNADDHVVEIGPDYPDHLSRTEAAKAKEIHQNLRREAKAAAKERRRAHHKVARDARARNARSRALPTTKAHTRKQKRDRLVDQNTDENDDLRYEEINERYEALINAS